MSSNQSSRLRIPSARRTRNREREINAIFMLAALKARRDRIQEGIIAAAEADLAEARGRFSVAQKPLTDAEAACAAITRDDLAVWLRTHAQPALIGPDTV